MYQLTFTFKMFIFMDKRLLKITLYTRHRSNIGNHTQKTKARNFKNSIEKRLLRDIHGNLKKWNFRLLLGPIISPITRLNFLFVLFRVQWGNWVKTQASAFQRFLGTYIWRKLKKINMINPLLCNVVKWFDTL